MTRKIVTLMTALVMFAGGPAGMATAQVAPPPAPAVYAAPAKAEMSYGQHPLQKYDLYRARIRETGPQPLIVFIHGGAWAGGDKSVSTGSAKIRHYTDAGYNLASVNYRLLPEVDIEDQAGDVAAAIADLIANARTTGIDTSRIVIMGHSAGAHLGALVATDPAYFAEYGFEPRDIAGVVLLDGAAYDVPRQIVDAGPLLGIGFQIAFGSRIGRQEALSPSFHADGDNARRFLLLHVERADSTRQAQVLDRRLRAEGTDAEILGFPGRGMEGHNLLNAMLGRSDSPATAAVDAWLEKTFALRS